MYTKLRRYPKFTIVFEAKKEDFQKMEKRRKKRDRKFGLKNRKRKGGEKRGKNTITFPSNTKGIIER